MGEPEAEPKGFNMPYPDQFDDEDDTMQDSDDLDEFKVVEQADPTPDKDRIRRYIKNAQERANRNKRKGIKGNLTDENKKRLRKEEEEIKRLKAILVLKQWDLPDLPDELPDEDFQYTKLRF